MLLACAYVTSVVGLRVCLGFAMFAVDVTTDWLAVNAFTILCAMQSQ